jgi:acetyltransferase-like isoleucine patch superfamily enzyme
MEPIVSDKANIGKNVRIGPGATIHDNVTIGDNTAIGSFCSIGEPTAGFYKSPDDHVFKETVIEENSIVRSHTVIYEDVHIGAKFQSGHHAVIREGNRFGHHTSFGSFSEVPCEATIGNYVRIHSKVMMSENNIIEDYVWIYPFVMLTNVAHPPVGDYQITTLKEYSQVCSTATILPGITIGRDAIVGAGALVTADVPDGRLAIGSPAKDVIAVADIRDDDGNAVYPWKDHLTEDRGYPWQQR